MAKLSRRAFLLAGAAGLAGAGFAYSRLGESGWLETRHVPVSLPGLASTVRVLVLSDLHYSSAVPISLIDRAIRSGLKESPDFACLGGDFITAGERPDLAPLTESLGRLAQQVPTFAVFGNHDGGEWASHRDDGFESPDAVGQALTRAGITILENQSLTTKEGVRLVGLADLWSGSCDPRPAFTGQELSEPVQPQATLVLAHNPDTKDLVRAFDWDLMISGHTHGGQIRVPLVGAPYAPVQDRRYIAGLNAFENRWVYTTRGVGSLFGVRFNCRPEVTILELSGNRGLASSAELECRPGGFQSA